MPPDSNSHVIEEIRLHSDIVETIGRYVPLKKSGQRFMALCPFHKEKTPSFHVDPSKQLYHCFGCGAGGDVFSFVQQYENISFPEAAQLLAERAGIRYERGEGNRGESLSEKQALYQLHEKLAHFYAESLKTHPGAEIARAYLKKRDLEEAVPAFQLGFAPPPPQGVAHWAKDQKLAAGILEKAGVLLPSDRGGAPYDRFKQRLMFPIRDEQGRVVGFSGRILDQSSNAKYVNSPETLLFHKSRLLYGLDRARQAMVETRQAIVCEGQIDVIRCHLNGFTNAAAPQGTALTESHALLLKRYADEVVLVFDADTAGQNAALRGAEALLQEGLTIRVTHLPAGEDPDSLLSAKGRDAFRALIENADTLVHFHARILRERGEFDSQAGRLRAAKAMLEVIQHAPSAVQREQYLAEAAEELGLSIDALREDLRRLLRPRRKTGATDSSPTPPIATPDYPPSELGLLELMIAHPEVLDLVHQFVPPEAITHPVCRTIIRAIMALPELEHGPLIQALSEESEECRRLAARLLMTARTIEGSEVSCTVAAQDIIINLRIKQIDRDIARQLGKAKSDKPDEKRNAISECASLTILKKRLQQGWASALPILELEH